MNRIRRLRVLQVIAWTVFYLVVLDLVAGFASRALRGTFGPQHSLVRYFDYGRSMEDKLLDVVNDPANPGNAVFRAGWLDPEQWQRLPNKAEHTGGKLIAVYGQSFAFRLADLLVGVDKNLTFRKIGGPGAPLNHSYAAYRLDQDLRRADVVVVGVLASSLCKLSTISGMALSFEMPAPYTFPGFRWQEGALVETRPALYSEREFKAALKEGGEAWSSFKQQYASTDPTFDGFKFNASSFDGSMLVRLSRRGWVASRVHQWQGEKDQNGVQVCMHDVMPAAIQILKNWQAAASASGEEFIVVLLQDRGYARVLTRTLRPALAQAGISVLDSSEFIDSEDPSVFIADGHYTRGAELSLAEALRGLLQ